MMSERGSVALLGAGTMGAGMARNIVKAGHPLRIWNRSPERAAPLAEAGAVVAATPAEAVDGADVVVTMLWDAPTVAEVMAAAGPGLAAGTVWIQTSTVGVDGTALLAKLADQLGVTFVDAPVLGTRGPAEQGTLVILASGPEGVRERCEPVLDAIGSRTLWLGPAGTGSRLKLVTNAWVAMVVEGVAECVTLADGLGVDPRLFLEAIRGGAMDSPYVQVKGTAMIDGDFAPAFTLSGVSKDVGLILAAATSVGVDVGVLRQVGQHFDRAVGDGHGDLDMAATYLSHRTAGG
jgi:3-hydroxyisobutyrate dehydrogenase